MDYEHCHAKPFDLATWRIVRCRNGRKKIVAWSDDKEGCTADLLTLCFIAPRTTKPQTTYYMEPIE